ncbi:ATP-dependent RNA helicase dbp10, partial [Spiromyces aspiralis]
MQGYGAYNQGGGTEGYENDYGVGSNVGGGGFMSSQGGGEESKRNYANQSLRPVTIKQILEVSPPHPDMPHKLDGEELKQLTFVGVIRNIEVQSINATYFIEDGTGQIEVRVWGNDGDDPVSSMEQQEGIGVNKYVRVYGDLKFFNNRRNILGHSIKPIKDFNEITYHYLEALYIHLTKTRGPV